MITRSIEEVKLSSAIADELIPSITGDGFRGDNSWLATMRALLPSRLPDGAKVQLKLLVKETPSKKSRAARLEYYLDGVDTESPYTITVSPSTGPSTTAAATSSPIPASGRSPGRSTPASFGTPSPEKHTTTGSPVSSSTPI